MFQLSSDVSQLIYSYSLYFLSLNLRKSCFFRSLFLAWIDAKTYSTKSLLQATAVLYLSYLSVSSPSLFSFFLHFYSAYFFIYLYYCPPAITLLVSSTSPAIFYFPVEFFHHIFLFIFPAYGSKIHYSFYYNLSLGSHPWFAFTIITCFLKRVQVPL